MASIKEYAKEIEQERTAKDRFFAGHPESPFRDGGALFHPLRYFPVEARFKVSANLVRQEQPGEVQLRTNQDGFMSCRHVGDLKFQLEGQELSLQIFHAGEQVGPRVFIPFRDATCGRKSYGPGRYLILDLHESDDYELDFNLAFNPYCAYVDGFECGFPPAENDLPIAVTAGEQAWSEERNPAGPSTAITDHTKRTLASRSGASAAAKPSPRAASRVAPKRSNAPKRAKSRT
jgi:uncharacterized protein (DUF1684 family)